MKKRVRCQWYENNKIQINPDGQVFPCCFIGNTMYLSKSYGYPKRGTLEPKPDPLGVVYELEHHENAAQTIADREQINIEYVKHEDELNINNHSIREILQHEWFQNITEARKEWDTSPRICKEVCGEEGRD